jgi:two-component system, OmpR family, sensor kinase
MNLFWKIWLGFWLSLLLMALGSITIVRLYDEERQQNPDQISDSKRVGFILEGTARALQEGGIRRFIELEKLFAPPAVSAASTGQQGSNAIPASRPEQPIHQPPFIVDSRGQDLLGRTVPPEAWQQANAIFESQSRQAEANQTGDGELNTNSAIKLVRMPNGQVVLIFMLNRMLPPERNLLFGVLETPQLLPLSALLASLIFSTLLARYLVRPIRILRDGLRQIASGRFDVTIRQQMGNRRDELGELGQDADKMAQQLKQLLNTQRRLLHDISHDLRSPLARLQVAIGLARQNPERLPEMLERLEHETVRLDGMIGEVLTLARLESGVPQPQEDYLDLVTLLQSLVEDARFENDSHAITLHIATADECVLACRGELLWRAFDNLLRNALQHTPVGSRVTLSLTEEPSWYLIMMQDTGPGIPAELLEEVFEPFHHAGDTRGHGLGLAIAKRAIEAHRGNIRAENATEGGLRIIIRLPRPPHQSA